MEACRVALKTRVRGPNETLSHLMKDICSLFLQAYPGQSSMLSEIMARDAFVNALQDRDLILKVMEREPQTLDQAFEIAERMELYIALPCGPEGESRGKQQPKVRQTSSTDEQLIRSMLETQKMMQKQIAALTETIQKSVVNTETKAIPNKEKFDQSKKTCFLCHKLEHIRPNCPELPKKAKSANDDEGAVARSVSSKDSSINKSNRYQELHRAIQELTKVISQVNSEAIPKVNSEAIPRVNSEAIPKVDSRAIPSVDSERIVNDSQMNKSGLGVREATNNSSLMEQAVSTPAADSIDRLEESTVKQMNGSNQEERTVRSARQTFYIELKIGDRRCKAVLDSGSEVTLIPSSQAAMNELQESDRKLRAANSTEINLKSEWKTVIGLGPLELPMNFLVSDQIEEILVGIDWMREHRCQLAFDSLTICLYGYCFPLLKKVSLYQCHRLILQQKVKLLGHSETIVDGKMVYANLRHPVPMTLMTETKECVPGVRTARAVINQQSGLNVPVRIVNTNDDAVTLEKGMSLCPL